MSDPSARTQTCLLNLWFDMYKHTGDAEYRGTAKRNNEKTERGISTNSDKTTTTRAHPTRVTSDSDKILASTSISYKAKDKTRFIASERARTSTTPYNTSITPNTSSSTTESSGKACLCFFVC